MVGILDSLFGGGDDGGDILRTLEENKRLWEGLDLPEYAEFAPELYNVESADYELVNEDPVLRSKQLETLARFEDLASEGLSDADRAGFAEARSLGDQIAKAKTGAALQDAQVRGVAGSGLEFAQREAGAQEAAQRAQQAAMEQAKQSAANRARYLEAYAGGLNSTRDQDYRAGAANTNIINQFNQANTQARNQTNQANVDSRNNAFMYNQGLKDKNFQNQVTKISGQTGANQGVANAYAARDAANQANDNALLGLAGTLGGAAIKKWG